MKKLGLNYAEVAARYGAHQNTVRAWVNKGLLIPTRFAGRVYFTETSLKEFEKKVTK